MAGSEPQITPQIDNLLILDRTVDLLTPLLSQLTYEGLIDEIFSISNSRYQCNYYLEVRVLNKPYCQDLTQIIIKAL